MLSNRMRVLVTRRLPGGALDRLAAEHEVEVWPDQLPPGKPELLARAPELDGLLSLLTDPVDAELIAAAPRLRAISNYAVGVDNVDLEAATRRGIPVGNTPGVLTDTTADLAVALMLGISRRLVQGDAYVRRGEWRTWETGLLLGHDLHGATAGIVGFGRIGQAVARRLEGFDCEVLHTGRAVREGAGSARPGAIHIRREGAGSARPGAMGIRGVALEELLGRSDFVTLHSPLTPETRGLIGDEALARMKPSAYLVNTARGPIVDSGALARALHAGEIAGAALDVTDPEPLPAGHPLLDAPNLLVLPHLGSATHATRERMADMAVDNLLAGLGGERMPHCANPEIYSV
jgi:glyoxylate reductase